MYQKISAEAEAKLICNLNHGNNVMHGNDISPLSISNVLYHSH